MPNDNRRFPTNESPNEDLTLYPLYLTSAKRLVEKLHMPADCIVITHVPSDEDLGGLAQYIGRSLRLAVLDPQVQGLFTFDRAHLTPESATRWASAFLQALKPVLQRCVGPHPAIDASAGLN